MANAVKNRLSKRTLAGVFASRIGALAAAKAEGDPQTSWIQLFKTGKFWDPRYGTFTITSADLSTMHDNVKNGVPEPPTRIPIDYNHGTAHPESPDEGKAAGWIVDVSLRKEGSELWGLVEWTKPAAEMIAAKEYQYVSPQFAYDYRHSTLGEIGTTLLAAAITNTPVLEGMTPLTLSRGALQLADSDEAAEDIYSFDEQRRRVQAALTEAFGMVYGFGSVDIGPCAGCYLVDQFDGRVIYREYGNNGSGGMFAVDYSIDTSGAVHFTSTPVEVISDYRPLGDQITMSKNTVTVKDAKGNDVILSEEVVLALAKEHAPAPPVVVPPVVEPVSDARLVELGKRLDASDAQILELTTANAALKLAASDKDAEDRVTKLVASGHITPADKEETLALAKSNKAGFDVFEKIALKRAPVVRYGAQVGSGEEGGVASAADEAIALSRTAMEKDAKLTSAAAMRQVFANDPALYARYKKEATVRV